MKNAKFLIFCLTTLVAFISSCSHDVNPLTEQPEIKYQKEIDNLVNEWGFDRDSIKVAGENLIVDGDMCFPVKGFWENYELKASAQNDNVAGDRTHYKTPNLITSTNVIPVRIDPDVSQTWKTAIYAAVAYWNAQKNSTWGGRLSFSAYESLNWNGNGVNVYMASLGYNDVFAFGYFPLSNGKPGPGLQINSQCVATWLLNATDKKYVIAHELGHTIGFRHTDQYAANSLINVSNYCNNSLDGQSLMRPGLFTSTSRTFSTCDIQAYHALYPY